MGETPRRSHPGRRAITLRIKAGLQAGEPPTDEFVAMVVVSGDFPGSPYGFAYRFKLRGKRIAEMTIDPIGYLAK